MCVDVCAPMAAKAAAALAEGGVNDLLLLLLFSYILLYF